MDLDESVASNMQDAQSHADTAGLIVGRLRSPLASLLDEECSHVVMRRTRELYYLLNKFLAMEELGFMRSVFGERWYQNLYLHDIEFSHDTSSYLEQRLPALKERIGILLDHGVSSRGKARAFATVPHFLTTEEETLKIYQSVLINDHPFPDGFFRHDNNRKAGIVTRYMCEDLLDLTPEAAFAQVIRQTFHDHDLGYMLASNFSGSVPGAIQNAYPQKSYSHLYRSLSPCVKSGARDHLVNMLASNFSGSVPGAIQDAYLKNSYPHQSSSIAPVELGALDHLVNSLDALFDGEN